MPATLPSNDGDKRLVIKLVAPAEYAHDAGFDSCVQFNGSHWDGGHIHPFSTSIDGLWLRSADLIALRNHIALWVARPLDRLDADDLTRNFELARLPGQSISFSFG